ncbi:helix-turn-helix transcriptional regulator [Clostridium sp.]|uniref:helix-turn-helix domain-containing protein n=1 Tax=Clostridium sp. TaxID=1506 RepID=UPI002908E6B3|nr:helix-turn-helix transcriptional regulator [Clostridium sp.]MDU4479903.1 helix-turn-helix transcriptional regulator [Clostridium sp.]
MNEKILFKDRLVLLRKELKLTQYQLAEKLGFSRGQIGNYEQGTREPDQETLLKISNFFDVSLDYLLGKTEYRKFNPEKLTDRDKKDIQNDLKNIMDNFRNRKGDQKYYNGVELDDDGLELMEAAMNIALEQIKIKNKKKYTPNKHRK